METRLRLCRHIATVTNSSIGYQNMVFVYIETLPQFVFEFDHFAPKPPPLTPPNWVYCREWVTVAG
jgi:hypothetical protein